MGDPKKPRKKYNTPRHPWKADQLSAELFLVGTYGLRNKRELWRTQTLLSKIRKRARTLLATKIEDPNSTKMLKEEEYFLSYLKRQGLIDSTAAIDDVLNLTIEEPLERRLQTVVWRKGIATTAHQARQMITHRHIVSGNTIITIPGYMVKANEDEKIVIRPGSTFPKQPAPSLPTTEEVSSPTTGEE